MDVWDLGRQGGRYFPDLDEMGAADVADQDEDQHECLDGKC